MNFNSNGQMEIFSWQQYMLSPGRTCPFKGLAFPRNDCIICIVYKSNMSIINPLYDNYKKICKIGQGSYGSVYLFERKMMTSLPYFDCLFAERKTLQSKYVAVKLYRKPNNEREGIDFSCLREINCLQSLYHDNIITCFEVIYRHVETTLKQPHEVYVVMDYHLELNDLLLTYKSIDDKKRIAKQITKGIHFLHSNFILHRVSHIISRI